MLRQTTLILMVLLMSPVAPAAEKRPMTVDDLLKFKRIADPQLSPNGKLIVYQVSEILDAATNKKQTHLWLAPTDGSKPPRPITSSGKSDTHPRWSPDGTKILFESSRGGASQLYVLDLVAGGEARKLTSISTGAGTGIWSPDGKWIAFVSSVYPEFSELPFVESDKKNAEKDEAIEKNPVKAKTFTRLFYRHWDDYVGDKRQHLFVITSEGKDCRDVTPGDRDANPTSSTFSVGDDFTFTPDSQQLVFTAVPDKHEAWSTDHNLCRVSIDNKSKNWQALTIDNPAADTSPRFSPDGKKLAWRAQSKAGYEADKWDILVVDVQPDGTFNGKPKTITASKDVSANEIAWSQNDAVVFTADDSGSSSVFSATLAGEVVIGIRHGSMTGGIAARQGHVSSLTSSQDGRIWAYSLARIDHPPELSGVLFHSAGGQSAIKSVGGFSPQNQELLQSLQMNRPESVQVKVEDGEMQMWVLKPPGFDPGKKWPVVYLVHGGPQGAWEDGWSFRWNPQTWAAQGYIIAMPNPRGSTGFGQKFVDQISGDWGGKCYRDLVAGVEYLKALPYVDKDRMGSAGGSFGGYMQNWFAVNEIAKDFKCLITHCSVWNFESMWGTTDELWFDEWEHQGLPWEKPNKYAEFSPHKKAANMAKYKTPVLIIHNDLDFRCPIGQGHELFSALQRLGVPSRFVNFPDEGHWVLKPANSKHWHQEVFGWLARYVPAGGK